MSELTTHSSGYTFLEVPRWRDGRLWVADMYAGCLFGVSPDGPSERVDVPGVAAVPAGIAWSADGSMLVLTQDGAVHELRGGDLVLRSRPSEPAAAPYNELTVTGEGHAYAGRFGLASGALVRLQPDGSVAVVAEDLLLPNGQAYDPQTRTLYVAESAGQRVTAFTVGDDGSLGERRTWAELGPAATARTLPEVFGQVRCWLDGIALDAEGALWAADPLGRQVLRLLSGGTVDQTVSTGDLAPDACALGGPDGRTLWVCVAPPGRDAATRRDERAASLLTTLVRVPAAV